MKGEQAGWTARDDPGPVAELAAAPPQLTGSPLCVTGALRRRSNSVPTLFSVGRPPVPTLDSMQTAFDGSRLLRPSYLCVPWPVGPALARPGVRSTLEHGVPLTGIKRPFSMMLDASRTHDLTPSPHILPTPCPLTKVSLRELCDARR
jgi:hypothetical protein